MVNYRQINYEVMTDTKRQYETIPELQEAVYHSIHGQFMVSHEEDIHQEPTSEHNTNIVISGKRSFEAAKGYKGKKVAVLNFAKTTTYNMCKIASHSSRLDNWMYIRRV